MAKVANFGLNPWLTPKLRGLAAVLVRIASWVCPIWLVSHTVGTAGVAAALLGAADGWTRLWFVRRAALLSAEEAGLRIDQLGREKLVKWSTIEAVESWRLINGLSFLAVHFRGENGLDMVTCWEHSELTRRDAFIIECAEHRRRVSRDIHVNLTSISDAPTLLRLTRRFTVDVSVVLLAGALTHTFHAAIVLAAISAGVSTFCEATRFSVQRRRYEFVEGRWHRVTRKRSEPLRQLPGSLRPWLQALVGSGDENLPRANDVVGFAP